MGMDKEEKTRLQEQKKRVTKANADIAKALKKEKRVDVMFQNLDMPGVELTFTYLNVNWRLIDGQVHSLPGSVIKHLQSRSTPIYAPPDDPKTIRHMDDPAPNPERQMIGRKPRFALMPTDMDYLEPSKERKHEESSPV